VKPAAARRKLRLRIAMLLVIFDSHETQRASRQMSIRERLEQWVCHGALAEETRT
jgi:hypothetical protein